MRVIAGKWKSHSLSAPAGTATRPTTDRVKESMFNLLPHVLEGTVVDLFAGSGALGIEALSRGADKAVFVDKDGRAIRTVRDNLKRLQAEGCAQVLSCDWRAAFDRLLDSHPVVSWIFLDPPYQKNLWYDVISSIPETLGVTGGILCELPKDMELAEQINHFTAVKQKTYGDIAVRIYERTIE